MPVVFVIAIVAVLVGVFFAATGRGGEMAVEQADHAPIDLGPVTAADIALLRPPTALLGYNTQVTDEALDHIASAMRERDVKIAYLQQQLADLEPRGLHAGSRGSHARLDPGELQDPQYPQDPQPPQTPLVLKASAGSRIPTQPSEILEPDEEPHEPTQPSETVEPRESTQPSETVEPREVVQPSELAGPQGSYDTHGWWAQQQEAERDEAREPAGHDEAEEQAW